MARPIWKGYITFGLVNIPVILYAAEKKFDIQFHLIDSRDKSKIRYARINQHTGKEVPWEKIAKSFEYDTNHYITIKDEDIKSMVGEHSKTIDIEGFVDTNSLDYIDFEKPYYLVPDKNGEKGYVILRETLKSTHKMGICKVIIHTREYLAALVPYQDALMLDLLRYHEELRKPAEFELPAANLKKYKITTQEMNIAKQLVNSMTTQWNPDDYHDDFKQALKKWIEEKVAHESKKIPRKKHETAPKFSAKIVDFVDLLKQSLEKKQQHKSHHPKKRAK